MKINRIERQIYLITPNFILRKVLPLFSKFNFFEETRYTQTPISFDLWYNQKVKGYCNAYWPVHQTSMILGWNNIYCGIETSPGLSPGNYISAFKGKMFIGDYTQIGPNVSIHTVNHNLTDNRKFVAKNVNIGKYCWLGDQSIILPGVTLGDYTIVAAGSIVTKSFLEGYCIIAGNPAKVIKVINSNDCVFHESKYKYNGYIKNEHFNEFREQNLNI
jgi:acetyltransferase-like isoleucine patch superfamily enzyme